METRANYVLIGLFTLAVIVGAFGFVYWFHHVGGTGERMTYRVMFQGPIGGLRSGAAVTFNGIRVGEVTDLSLDVGPRLRKEPQSRRIRHLKREQTICTTVLLYPSALKDIFNESYFSLFTHT